MIDHHTVVLRGNGVTKSNLFLAVNSMVIKHTNDGRTVLQGAVNTSLETLHQLASGSTVLVNLKKQLKVSVPNLEETPSTHQVRKRRRKI